MNRQRYQPKQGHQLMRALLVVAITTLAVVIVIVTRSTAGLRDLAPLLVTISGVALPLAIGHSPRRNRR